MLQVEYRPRAALDIESALVYIGEVLGNPPAAKRLHADLKMAVARLCEMPLLGKAFGDAVLERNGYRSFLVGHYRVFYTYDEEKLTVWRVIHTWQDIDDFELIGW